MSLVISDEVDDDAPGVVVQAFSCHIEGVRSQCSVIFRPFSIEIYQNGYDLVHQFDTEFRIVAANHLAPPEQNGDWLLVLNETNTLLVIKPSKTQVTVIQTFKIADILTKLKPSVDPEAETITTLSVNPLLEVDAQSRYFILHSCRQFIFVFELRPSKAPLFEQASANSPPAQVSTNPEAAQLKQFKVVEDPYVVSVGTSPIEHITFLPKVSSPAEDITWFGMATRDSSLRYSLSWYKIYKLEKLHVEVVRRMTALESRPDIMFALPDNAIYIVCGIAHYCYPAPDLKMYGAEIGDAKSLSGYASRSLPAPEAGGHAAFVTTYDGKNMFLLFSKKGSCYSLTLNATITESTTGEMRTGRFDLTRWEFVKRSERIGSHFVPSFVMRTTKDWLMGVSQEGQIAKFKESNFPKWFRILDERQRLPITFLSCHDSQRRIYASGTYEGSHMCYGSKRLELEGSTVKKVVTIDSTDLGLLFVVLTEAHVADESMEGELNISDRITVYDSNFTELSHYQFDLGCSCIDLISLEGFKPFMDIESTSPSDLSESFLSVSNFLEDSTEKTELLLFSMVDEDSMKLSTMATLNREVDYLLRLRRKCILFGPHSIIWITIHMTIDGLKIMLADKCLGLPCAYITEAAVLDDDQKELLVADTFEGLYYIRLADDKDEVELVRKLLSSIQITTFELVGRDRSGLALGDLEGNFYLFQLKSIQGKLSLSMFFQTNLLGGTIGVIDAPSTTAASSLETMLTTEGVSYPLCTVGTNNGSLLSIEAYGRSRTIDMQLNRQSYKGINSDLIDWEKGSQGKLEMELPETDTESTMDLDKLHQMTLDRYWLNEAFLEKRFVRRLPGTNMVRVHHAFTNSLPEVTILDRPGAI